MRLHSLGLIRYGAFTDRLLEFDPTARLTVIHGANEAGKSTALAAVADALFGIEDKSRFNFQHEYKTMRLQARVARPDGHVLHFARLKRHNAPLVDPDGDDTPLANDCLAAFLGLHDRRAFLDIFGLNQTSLRRGGRQLLEGNGDLAASLLSAAPGLGHIAAVRDRLAKSASDLFNPARRNANHPFYRAVDARDAARKAIREQELRTDEAKRLREAAEQSAQAREIAVSAEIEAGLAHDRARIMRAAARELRVLDAQLVARAELGALPQAPAGFVAEVRALLAAQAEAHKLLNTAREEEALARAALEGIEVDDTMLAFADQILACDEERIAVEDKLKSLPNRRAEAKTARKALAAIATQLDLPLSEDLHKRLPHAAVMARCETLLDRLRAHDARAEALAGEEATLAARRRALDAAGASLGHAPDPAPFKQRFAALDGAEERERSLQTLEAGLADERRGLAARAARLGSGAFDVEALIRLPLPDLAVATAMLRALKDSADGLAHAREARLALAEQQAQTALRLASLREGRPAPTEEVIAAARHERDALWEDLRPLALGQRTATADDSHSAARFDHAVAAADRLVDQRQTETARLSELARLTLEIADQDVRLAASASRVDEAGTHHGTQHEAWQRLWPPALPAVGADEQALVFVREHAAIVRDHEALCARDASADSARTERAWSRQNVEQLRADLGLPPLGDAPLQVGEVRDAIGMLERRFQAARDHARDLALTSHADEDLRTRRAAQAQERTALDREAAELFPALALRHGAGAREIRDVLTLWREARVAAGDLDKAEHRALQIEDAEHAFRARMEALITAAAPLEAGGDPIRLAAALRVRLDCARQQKSKSDMACQTLDERKRTLVDRQAKLARTGDALLAALELNGLAAGDDLAGALDRMERGALIDAAAQQARERLADIIAGLGEAEVRALIGDSTDEDLARLAAKAEAAHLLARTERDQAVERDTRDRAALAEFDSRQGAVQAAQDEQDAITEIADTMERFTRDHVAARLLSVAIERYREQHQDPIIARASEAFSLLTCGRWDGIRIDYDQPTPRLAARREGQLYGVDALSEGTADQLFLALRIAAIEDHAGRAAPLPFIADDLFVTFDRARTAAGLHLLAQLGRHTQVIVFTHHDHVVEVASELEGAAIIQL